MSNDKKNVDEVLSDTIEPDESIEDDLFDDEVVDEDVSEDAAVNDDDADDSADSTTDSDAESDTEALDDLEAEELEMLTEDEASETIVVDEATQLRDIRRAQISIEASSAGGVTEGEFVCSICFLVKKSSQLSSRRKKVCLDCAV
ncbi:MAG: DUF4193 family protein [bacterium]|nr:DUF4193 family protein [bacterium]MCP4968492.1 DUF4193 family protein [bacterium]